MVLELVSNDHPLLYTKLDEFDFTNPPVNPGELANNLIETLVEKKGLGLSANQCGLPYRVFVMWSNPTKVCFNPRVVTASEEIIQLDEGCLSFPNLFLKIKRPQRIKVRYENELGETFTETFVGMTARCFLHELDHMNGKLYTTRANPIHLQRAQNEQKKINRQLRKLNEHQHSVRRLR